MTQAPALGEFVKHAERYAHEAVFQTAEEVGLPAVDLGRLARHLRRIDNTWRLEPAQRNRLIRHLLDTKTPDKEIRDMTGVSQDTLSRTRKGLGVADQGVQNRSTMRREVRKLEWDEQHPYQTVSAYLSASETLAADPLEPTVQEQKSPNREPSIPGKPHRSSQVRPRSGPTRTRRSRGPKRGGGGGGSSREVRRRRKDDRKRDTEGDAER